MRSKYSIFIRKRLLGSRRRIAALIAVVAIILIAAGGGSAAFVILGGGGSVAPATATPSGDWQPVQLASESSKAAFDMTAEKSDGIGVDPGSQFILTSDEDVDSDFVRSRLQVDPAIELTVEKVDSRRFEIVPSEPLQQGQMYHFSLVETNSPPHVLGSWAFETKSPIRVVQTLPADQSTNVPLNTGIELTFSYDGVQDVDKHFQIDPPVEGRFEVHKRVVVFVPQALSTATLYTVTVRAGVGVSGTDDVMANDFVFQFETGDTERTGSVARPDVLNFTRKLAEAGTSEAPVLAVSTTQNKGLTVPITVYRYADVQTFLAAVEKYQAIPSWASVTRNAFLASTDGLDAVASFDTTLQRQTDYGDAFLTFPDALPEGFYLVEAQFEGHAVQSWLQVTDVASYVSVSRDKTLIWVNDLATKAPLAGAKLELLGTDVATVSDDQGTAFIDTPSQLLQNKSSSYGYNYTQTSGNILVTAADGRSAIVPLSDMLSGYNEYGYRTYGYSNAGDDYWLHISTDRPLYQPTDTIRFWGVALPRENPPSSETLTIELTGSSYVDYYYQPVSIAETQVNISALGTFSGELSFAGLSPGYYDLNIKANDQVIDSMSVDIETYTKPAYKIDVVPSKQAVFDGDQVDFDVTASFFDGSPVPQLQLQYQGAASGQLTTDDQGKATATITAHCESTGWASTSYFSVTPVLAEEGEITGESWVSVYPASLAISATSDLEADQGVVKGTVHKVDLSRMNAGTAKDYQDYLGDPAGGVTVSEQVTEESWNKTEVGEYYDFVAKVTRKQYQYDEVDTPLGTFNTTTSADGSFNFAFPIDEEKYYQIALSVTDGSGRTNTYQLYIWGHDSLYNGNSEMVYIAPQGGSENYYGGRDQYALGDEAVLEMRRGAEVLPNGGDNSYLFYQAQNGLRKYAVQSDSTFRLTFGEDNIPSTTVLGVWFNGRTYQEVHYGYTLDFDQTERKLDIQVTPDKERYEPGDTANLGVLVEDQAGNPQANAEVNLAVVDEAIFQIQGPNNYIPDILSDLYRPVGDGIVYTYASHQYPVDEQQAERGGDGGARRDFADVAFFGQVTTGPDGHASVSFKLPDNLTSWRVTAQGITADLKAGTTLRQIPVGLPFFVDVTMNDEYLTTDQPEIKLRSYGVALQSGQEVTFEVTAPSLGLTEPLQSTAPAFQATRVSLPALTEGDHELTITATAGGMSDSVVRTIHVVPSRLVKGEANYHELQDGLKIEGSSSGPTRLIFSDQERGRYLSILRQLTWGYGDRVDQMLARDVAAGLLNTYFDEEEAPGQEFDASLYQTKDGGIALFPYADADLTLSARVAALAPDRVGRNALTGYFLAIVQDQSETRERQIIALYGLAALGEPVQVSVKDMLAEKDLNWRERLYLGLAALSLGDDTTARTVYQGLLQDYGESRQPFARLRVGTDQDDILEATSLAAILGAGLGDDLAPALFGYTTANYATDILVELEQISYLQQVLPHLSPEAASFAYTLDGQRHEVTLDPGHTFALQVTPEQLRGLKVEPLKGHVGVAASYTAPLNPADLTLDPDISVSRHYESAAQEGIVVEEGNLVQITLDYSLGPQALDGCYQVSDLLPSGLKAVTRTSAWDLPPGTSYPYMIEGQRVSFCVTKDVLYHPIVYYARVVSAGKYTAEPATIQSMQSAQSMNLSSPDSVEVR
ncbi:MAG: Ig-like domain-containing protein [Dehalococcoidia bacterium]